MSINSFSKEELSCGNNWTTYKDEKCFITLNEVGLVNYNEAEKICVELKDDISKEIPRILTVKSEEEQEFINNYLFMGENEIVDHVWLGLIKNEKTGMFEWIDGAQLMLTNWAQRTLAENNLSCTQLEHGETTFGVGQWVKVSCKKRNVVVCEKIMSWPLNRVQHAMISVSRQLATSVIKQEEAYKDMSDLKKYNAEMDARMGSLTAKHELQIETTNNLKQGFGLLEQKLLAMAQKNEVTDKQMNLFKQVSEVTIQNCDAVKKELQDSKQLITNLNNKYEVTETQIVTITEKIEIMEELISEIEKREAICDDKMNSIKNEEDSKIQKLNQEMNDEGKQLNNLAAKVETAEAKVREIKPTSWVPENDFDRFKTDIDKKIAALKEIGQPLHAITFVNANSSKHQESLVPKINLSNVAEQKGMPLNLGNILTENQFILQLQVAQQKIDFIQQELEKQIQSLAERTQALEKIVSSNHKGFLENPIPIVQRLNDTAGTPQRVSSTAQNVSSTPQHVSNPPQHVSNTLQHVSSTPQHVSNTPQHVSSTPQHVSSNHHTHVKSGWKYTSGTDNPNGTLMVHQEVGDQPELSGNVTLNNISPETWEKVIKPNLSNAAHATSNADEPTPRVTSKGEQAKASAGEPVAHATRTAEKAGESVDGGKSTNVEIELSEAQAKIRILEVRHQKLEQIVTTLQENTAAIPNVTPPKKPQMTEEMINTQKQDLENSISQAMQKLELKIMVLEQKSDVSDQMFAVLKKDSIMKIGALEQRITAHEKKNTQKLPDKEEKPAQPQEMHTVQSQETSEENNEVQRRRYFTGHENETELCCAIPLGFTYVQFPGQPEPAILWPSSNWTDISTEYSGLFFRAVGGLAAKYGEVQEEDSSVLQVRNNLDLIEDNTQDNETFGKWSNDVYAGTTKSNDRKKSVFIRFRFTRQEIRPRNIAIKIWKSEGKRS